MTLYNVSPFVVALRMSYNTWCFHRFGLISSVLSANFLDSGTGFWEFNYAGEACEARVY